MKKIGLVILFLIILGAIITFYLQKSKAKMEVQKISFVTKDGVTIVANYYPNKSAKFAGILVHMRPKTKESFDNLAKFLQNQGYALLAIDLRGHGESTESVKGN
jgi:alpha-beta hydrolase superfamily lysophospholipase